jgi:hypothetical protein
LTKAVKRWIVSFVDGGTVMVQRLGAFDIKNMVCLIFGGFILILLSPLILAYVVFVALGIRPKGFA